MIKNIVQNKIKFIAISLSLITALYLSFSAITPAVANLRIERELPQNCSNFNLQQGIERSILLNPDNRAVYVRWFANGGEFDTRLPYNPQNGFSGCSQEAKILLSQVQEVYEKQVADSCADFKAIINGNKSLPEKNGRKANIQGAINFVDQYCK